MEMNLGAYVDVCINTEFMRNLFLKWHLCINLKSNDCAKKLLLLGAASSFNKFFCCIYFRVSSIKVGEFHLVRHALDYYLKVDVFIEKKNLNC